jgi:hypothetical protein
LLSGYLEEWGMSFTDRLMVWFHIGFVIFTIGPVTIATMSTPRYIRARNVGVLRYLSLMTRIIGAGSLGVLLFGIIAAQSLHKISQAWITASLTLFVVAAVLLLLIMRDQRRAIGAVEASLAAAGHGPASSAVESSGPAGVGPAGGGPGAVHGGEPAGAEPTAADVEPAPQGHGTAAAQATAPPAGQAAHVATVERGRIASLAGVVSLIWLVTLVLMVWNS